MANALQPLTSRSRVVSNKRMTLMERIYLPAIVGGLLITIRHMFRTKRPTIQYPEEKRPMSDNYRGQHVLKRDDGAANDAPPAGFVRSPVLPRPSP